MEKSESSGSDRFRFRSERMEPGIHNTLEQMFESVSEVLYRQRYGTKRPQVSEAEQAPRAST